jgi:hypothetical protein
MHCLDSGRVSAARRLTVMRRAVLMVISCCAPAAAVGAEQLDQSLFDRRSSPAFGTGSPVDFVVAQTYTAGISGTLSKVKLHLSQVGSGTLQIRNAVSGLPGDTILASAPIPTSGEGVVEFVFSAPVLQVSGTQYAIVVTYNTLLWLVPSSVGAGDATAYARGKFVYSPTGTPSWNEVSITGVTYDAEFATYVTLDEPPIVSVLSPYEAASYVIRDKVQAIYSCSDDIQLVSCVGAIPNGSFIDTRTPGTKQFTATATDSGGHVTVRSFSYTVLSPSGPLPTRGKP